MISPKTTTFIHGKSGFDIEATTSRGLHSTNFSTAPTNSISCQLYRIGQRNQLHFQNTVYEKINDVATIRYGLVSFNKLALRVHEPFDVVRSTVLIEKFNTFKARYYFHMQAFIKDLSDNGFVICNLTYLQPTLHRH